MKQTAWTKFLNWVLVTLGFSVTSSCIPPVMYGSPTMDYELSGRVVDEENNPIKGIRVVSPDRDTSFTDARGAFYVSGERITYPYAKFEDIDGPENGGEFKDKTEFFDWRELEQVEKGSGWYEGKYIGKDIVVTLEKKED